MTSSGVQVLLLLCVLRESLWAVLMVPGIKVGLDMCKAMNDLNSCFTSPTQKKFLLLLQVSSCRLRITAQRQSGLALPLITI